ncbi:ergothioneine biosynthesis protein EgtB [Hoeflea prorocentri]
MTPATNLAPSAETGIKFYQSVRARSEALVKGLTPEDMTLQSMEDASPAKWHLAHTTWFFEEFILKPRVSNYRSPDERFAFLFNSYYVQAGPRHMRSKRGMISRPAIEEVLAYRAHVDDTMRRLLSEDREDAHEIRDLAELGCHHEMQHQELLVTDLLHALSHNPLMPAYRAPEPIRVARERPLQWIDHEGGLVEIGHGGGGFAYDCEGPRHKTYLQPFRLASRPVTNRDWIAFMDDGGYRTATLWLSDGWARCQQEDWDAPLYWWRQDGEWWSYTLRGPQPVNLEAPVVHVSYYEADAFARWSGKRLPTEAEWEVVARERPIRGNFLESSNYRPMPTDVRPRRSAGEPEDGEQFWGDVWEWTQSPFTPYPGFRPPEGAIGEYNGKFMCNQFVLRGGSCATPLEQMRDSYRTFFYPHQRWQMLGLRLADDTVGGGSGHPRGKKISTQTGDVGEDFAASILSGLTTPRKTIEAKWLYDAEGSALFDQITELEEYYPTRTETAILSNEAHRLAAHVPEGAALVELGSGSSVKTRLLLDALPSLGAYVPVDISVTHLEAAAERLAADYVSLDVHPVVADFTSAFAMPQAVESAPKVLFFPGSTIGNFEIDEAAELMARLRKIEDVDTFVIGFDLVKERKTLLRAYDDSDGVTARFNLNLLSRINRELEADFDVSAFTHQACWNEDRSRIEMHLVSSSDQSVTIAGETVRFSEGETIHTENSHKYTPERFEDIANEAGWSLAELWMDENNHFAVAVLT